MQLVKRVHDAIVAVKEFAASDGPFKSDIGNSHAVYARRPVSLIHESLAHGSAPNNCHPNGLFPLIESIHHGFFSSHRTGPTERLRFDAGAHKDRREQYGIRLDVS